MGTSKNPVPPFLHWREPNKNKQGGALTKTGGIGLVFPLLLE
jgi:hypothetical protein